MATTAHDHVRRTLADFCHFTDRGDFDAWVELFTDDGEFQLLGQTFRGHSALREFIEQDQPPERRGLHLTTDSRIDVDGGTATASSTFIFVAAGVDGPVIVAGGTYVDEFVLVSGRWLFRSRECELSCPPRLEGWGRDSAPVTEASHATPVGGTP